MTLLNCPTQFVATPNWIEKFRGVETLFFLTVMRILEEYPYDLLVFEQNGEYFQTRLAGYHLQTQDLNEEKVVFRMRAPALPKFWVKVDDYGGTYIVTFLLPEDY